MRLATLPSTALVIALALPATAAAAGPPADQGYYPIVPHPRAFSAAAGPKVITYAGSTSQDSPVVIQLSRDARKVVRVAAHWVAPCASGMSVVYGDTFTASSSVSGGRLKVDSAGTLDFGDYQGVVTQRITGKLGAKRGSGRYRAHVDVIERATGTRVDDCDAGPLNWNAPGPQELVYGGTTSAGEPVVLTLDKKRKNVREIAFGWSASCRPDGFVSYGDALVAFPLSRTGAWGDVFTQTFPLDGGGTNVFAYEIKGKVGAAKASGTFSVTRTLLDLDGGIEAVCATAAIRFSARQ